jgi:hypothetical protein
MVAGLIVALVLAGCATTPPDGKGTWAGRPIGPPPAARPALKRAIIATANAEWAYFDRQTVVFRGTEESIPHVGDWEDDDQRHSRRINAYWRAAGHPEIDGMDCSKPWSAVFITYLMQRAGVPDTQLRPAIAHWEYLSQAVAAAPRPGRWFVPRRVADYAPRPGDLICASRGLRRPRMTNGDITSRQLRGLSTHCDLVVATKGRRLEAIGGNVRNSVSKVSVGLDGRGRLKPIPRRPWFIILENRL